MTEFGLMRITEVESELPTMGSTASFSAWVSPRPQGFSWFRGFAALSGGPRPIADPPLQGQDRGRRAEGGARILSRFAPMRGTSAAPARNLDRLPRLTGLRAVAALVVFAHHVRLVAEWRSGEVLEVGYLGVSLFFVLSGFVLAWATRPGDSAARFYRRRFARIYPASVVGIVLAVMIDDRPSVAPLLANLALVQAWIPDLEYSFGVSSPNWSLSCEAFFYAAFPLGLPVLARRGLG